MREEYNWWDCSKGQVHERVTKVVARLEGHSEGRHAAYLSFLRSYAPRYIPSLAPDDYAQFVSLSDEPDDDSLGCRNILRSMGETMLSKLASNPSRPRFLPTDATPLEKERCRQRESFVHGMFEAEEYDKTKSLINLDAIIFGVGLMRVSWKPRGKKKRQADIELSHVHPWQLLYDAAACQSGNKPPREMYFCRLVSRDLLASHYPKAKALIADLPSAHSAVTTSACVHDSSSHGTVADRVRVIECWRLPSGEDAGDGVYAIVTDHGVLERKPYEHLRAPFAALRFGLLSVGYWLESYGLIEALRKLQKKLGRVTEKVDNMFDSSISVVVNPRESGIANSSISNALDLPIWNPKGPPPTVVHGQPVHPQMLDREQQIVRDMREDSGLSKLSTSSEKPSEVKSGEAMKTLHSFESERFQLLHKHDSHFAVDIARLIVEAGHDAASAGYNVESFLERGGSYVDRFSYKELFKTSDADKFVIRPGAASKLPHDLAGRLDAGKKLIDAGALPPNELLEMLELPDLSTANKTYTASKRAVERDVHRILSGEGLELGDSEVMPDSYDDVAYAASYAKTQYLEYRRGLDEKVVEQLQRYIDLATALMPPPQPAPQEVPVG